MATQTLTADAAIPRAVAKMIEAGAITVPFRFDAKATAFGTTGDVLLLAKIPNQVTVTDAVISVDSAADTATIVRMMLGTQQILDTATASSTGAPVTIRANGIPRLNTMSDDAEPLWRYLTLEIVAGTETASFICKGTVTYHRGP